MFGNGGFNYSPNGFLPNNFQQQQIMRQLMMQQQNNNIFSNNFQQWQQPMMQQLMMQQQIMRQQIMRQQIMQQQNVDDKQCNNQQNNLPEDDKDLSSSIAQGIINVILDSGIDLCWKFQKALNTKDLTDKLKKNPEIVKTYQQNLSQALQKILGAGGETYKKINNDTLRIFGCTDRIVDFTNDKIISYYAYGGEEAYSMKAFFEGKNYYEDRFTGECKYFDIIKCEYDLNNKTYKIIITLQDTEKEVIFKGDDVNNITGVSSEAHGFNVIVNGVYVSMSNDINKINQNFKDNNLKITADFIEPNKENTTHTNNNINDQDKFYDNFNYEKTDSGCPCFNWCSDCLKSCKEKCFTHEN